MNIDFDRAVDLVRDHGDEFDQVVLDGLLAGEGSVLSNEAEQRFFAGQRPDGGWAPSWAKDYSSLDATCFQLAQAEMMLGLYGDALEHALAFLGARQHSDGSFEEDELARDLAPHWAKPGDLAARLYLTANCGWWLANARAYGNRLYLDAARHSGDYLLHHLRPNGSFQSSLQTHWLAAALWIRVNWTYPPVLPEPTLRVLDYLATRMNEDVPSGALAWMLTTLAPIGVPDEHPLIKRATQLLASQQRTNGSWASEDGPEQDAYVTREALRALIMWRAA